MNTKLFNAAFLFFWVALCLGMLFRHLWMPVDVQQKISDERAYMIMMVAGVFALWNMARLFAASMRSNVSALPSPEVEAYRRRIRAMSGQDPKVTDPQFNFDDPPLGSPPADRPSA